MAREDDPNMWDDGGGASAPPPASPPAVIPPGYQWNPQTGRLEPTAENLATKPQTGNEANFDPNTNYDSGPWANGQPTNAPAGWHWDQGTARFVKDGAGPTPTPGPDGGPAGPASGSLIQPFQGTYQPFNPANAQPLPTPASSMSTIGGAPQFPTIPKFTSPTVDEAMADPGYAFTLDQGNKNLQNWAGARGTLNDSSTAKAMIDYGQGAASTQYGNVWDRAYNAYNTNVQTQYLDPFAAQYQNWMSGTVNPTMSNFSTQAGNVQHQNDMSWQDNWNNYLQSWNVFRDQRDSTFNKQFATATA